MLAATHLVRPGFGEGTEGVHQALAALRCVQLDPLDPIGTNADLVLHARVDGYQRGDWAATMPGGAFEHFAKERCLLPADQFPLYRDQAAQTPWWRLHERLKRLPPALIEAVLEEVRHRGPLTTQQLSDHGAVQPMDWSGWKGTGKAASLAIEVLWTRCQVVTAGRTASGQRIYDVPQRALPEHVDQPAPPFGRTALQHRIRAAGLMATAVGPWWGMLRPQRDDGTLTALVDEGDVAQVQIAGSRRTWLAPAELLTDAARARWAPATGPRRPAARARPPRPAHLESRPGEAAVGLRVRLGGLQARQDAAVGLVRVSAVVPGSAGRPHRGPPGRGRWRDAHRGAAHLGHSARAAALRGPRPAHCHAGSETAVSGSEPLVYARDLRRVFRTFERRPGVMGAVRDLFRLGGEDRVAVDGIDLDIHPGERVGLIGPNGAGKSTTIKMLTGVLTPTSGHLRVAGREPSRDRKAHVRDIGVVFGQRTQLWWDLAVLEAFDLLASVFQVPAADYRSRLYRFDEVLDIGPLLGLPVRELSLGQRMRCDIAAALLHGHQLLFLDEPTIGLDVAVKLRIRDFIAKVNQESGTTVLLTTHDLGDIEAVCERVVLIDHGAILFDGTAAALKASLGGQRRLVVDLAQPLSAEAAAALAPDLPVPGSRPAGSGWFCTSGGRRSRPRR